MTALLWYVVGVHVAAALFFLVRWWQRRRGRLAGYRITGLFAYLAVGPAVGAARELQLFRAHVAGALTLVSAVLGTLLLLFIWDAHLRRGHP